jgi:site-specific DNA-methyltransferase (cytosine-N4-specific)
LIVQYDPRRVGFERIGNPTKLDLCPKPHRSRKGNLIAIPNTESNSFYLRYCESKGLKPHPARFPAELPEYFVRMLTEPGDLVIDPFAGSCVTGEVCERTGRRWVCIELVPEYCDAALGRFIRDPQGTAKPVAKPEEPSNYYRVPRPGILWNGNSTGQLPEDGGKKHRLKSKADMGASKITDGRGADSEGTTAHMAIEVRQK